MQYDVFISYAHNDNWISPDEEDGWIDSFHKALFKYLSSKLGRKANIWRDHTKLRGNDLLDETLINDIKNSQIFIPILSPSFINSKYCLKELDVFYEQSTIIKGTKTFIFPVVKSPVEVLPAKINSNLIKFEFIVKDGYGESYDELDPSLGEKSRNEFNQRIMDLAREIDEFMKKHLLNQPPVTAVDEGVPVIYLAEPSPDLFDKYLDIKRDLEERRKQGLLKFEFLPQPLPEDLAQIAQKPNNAEKYKEMIRTDLQNSRLTIHLIGKRHNYAPFGSTQSYLDLAMEAAAERDGKPNYNRLVWIPKNLYTEEELQQNDDDPHKAFIKNIRQQGVRGDGLMQDSFEEFKSRIIEVIENKPKIEILTQDSFEEFKSRIIEVLENKSKTEFENFKSSVITLLGNNPKIELPPEEPDTRWIYVLFDESDLEAARLIEEQLKEKLGYPIFSSRHYLEQDLSSETKVNAIEAHNTYLTICDAVLIYWQQAQTPWVYKNLRDLQGIKANRNGRNFYVQAVFCDGNQHSRQKADLCPPPPKNLLKIDNIAQLTEVFPKLN